MLWDTFQVQIIGILIALSAIFANSIPIGKKMIRPKSQPPILHYWHVYCDKDGLSHQKLSSIEGFTFKTISEGSSLMWQSPGIVGSTRTLFVELIPGSNGGWHENPMPQWIIPLSGRWFVETMDGMRVEMGPGELSYGNDQGCSQIDGHSGGHLSGAVGDEPTLLMLIQKLD